MMVWLDKLAGLPVGEDDGRDAPLTVGKFPQHPVIRVAMGYFLSSL